MNHIKRIPLAVLPILLVVAGAGAVVVGVHLLFGLAFALIVGGILAAVAGLLVDVA